MDEFMSGVRSTKTHVDISVFRPRVHVEMLNASTKPHGLSRGHSCVRGLCKLSLQGLVSNSGGFVGEGTQTFLNRG